MQYCESCPRLPQPHYEEVPLDTWKADVLERLTEIRGRAVAT